MDEPEIVVTQDWESNAQFYRLRVPAIWLIKQKSPVVARIKLTRWLIKLAWTGAERVP